MDVRGVLCGVLFLGHTGVLAREILRYAETQHSRNEAGVPGSNVTGTWSWVDSAGERHSIWYVADTGGFRAFGDGIPEASPTPLVIGTPVVVGRSAARAQQKTLSVGTPALSQSELLRRTNGREAVPPVASPLHQIPGSGDNAFKTEVVSSDAADSTKSRSFTGQRTDSPDNVSDNIDQSNTSIFISTSVLPSKNTLTNTHLVPQPQTASANSGRISETLGSPLTPDDLIPSPLAHTGSDSSSSSQKIMPPSASENILFNKEVNKVGMIQTGSTAEADQGLQKQLSDSEFLMTTILGPISGTDFVIIDKLRVPNAPKPRVGSQQLVPQPVPVKGQPAPVIMGLHTSGRPPRKHKLSQETRPLQPLGIHLLNLVPFRGNSKSINSNGPVPKPMRIVGAPNLENFYRPATLAQTTPSPFRLPRPIRDYDYQYYDYQYYDYTENDGDNGGGGPNKSTRSSNRQNQDSSDESSAEPDFVDSEEKDD
ncbi:uncharacterized protein LOC125042696 [Penaeus chinensis]|uniref:uncharacterized protein LOC125042696 n=1 Tax=Penaeus chinensis TaxID=139456 RepID=UPI001FB70333|nr:uncharacterized protein LOC125042696 [Penaeus chinensis]